MGKTKHYGRSARMNQRMGAVFPKKPAKPAPAKDAKPKGKC